MTDARSDDVSPLQSESFFLRPDPAKLEALAEFAAGAGHEINNPLATIIGRAQLLLKDERDPQRRQMLMSIGAQAYRIRDMIGDAMLVGRPPRPDFQAVPFSTLAQEVARGQRPEMAAEGVTLQRDVAEDLVLRADPAQLSIVLAELLRNARQALFPHGGEIRLKASPDIQDPSHALIEIMDRGKGFSAEEREHAFDPFFSGRQAGRGLGFGLTKCWRIVEQHGAQIEIQSAMSGPTTVRIRWPVGSGVGKPD